MTDDGIVNSDDVLAVAACQRFRTVPSDRWPMIAAQLVAGGFDGADLVELAALSANASGYEVDPLVPGALTDIGAPELTIDQAAEIYARVVATMATPGLDHPIVRALAWLAPDLDFPDGIIDEAYYASEWLDCDCCADSEQQADALEARLATLSALHLSAGLMDALLT